MSTRLFLRMGMARKALDARHASACGRGAAPDAAGALPDNSARFAHDGGPLCIVALPAKAQGLMAALLPLGAEFERVIAIPEAARKRETTIRQQLRTVERTANCVTFQVVGHQQMGLPGCWRRVEIVRAVKVVPLER